MGKILTVVGARPQFVKAAMVSRALRLQPHLSEVLVHTGQHYDPGMSDIFFEELGLHEPAYNLHVGSGRQGAQTGAMLAKLEEVVSQEQPDLVLTYGDTNSTLAAALVAAKATIPLAHVEAGLRSFNAAMPEEINRIVTDRLSALLFAPTERAVENLRHDGLAEDAVFLVGDVMFDAALTFGRATARPALLAQLGLVKKEYMLATVHRAENTDSAERLRAILGSLATLSTEIPVLLPLHPRTRSKAGALPAGIRVVEPLGYLDMLALQRSARVIATDSGGVQKEAFFNGVPCVTFRTETEWVELVEGGWNRLADPSDERALTATLRSLVAAPDFPARPADIYGGGQASEAIGRIVAQYLG